MAVTTNYSWIMPTVSGDSGAWGTILNNAIIAIDAQVKNVANYAATMLPLSGGVMSGSLITKCSAAARIDKGTISGAQSFDLGVAQCYTLTLGGAMTMSWANWPGGLATSAVMLTITNAGLYGITWPVGTKWTGGVPPAFTASGKDRIAFISDDGGVTAHAIVVGLDVR